MIMMPVSAVMRSSIISIHQCMHNDNKCDNNNSTQTHMYIRYKSSLAARVAVGREQKKSDILIV